MVRHPTGFDKISGIFFLVVVSHFSIGSWISMSNISFVIGPGGYSRVNISFVVGLCAVCHMHVGVTVVRVIRSGFSGLGDALVQISLYHWEVVLDVWFFLCERNLTPHFVSYQERNEEEWKKKAGLDVDENRGVRWQ